MATLSTSVSFNASETVTPQGTASTSTLATVTNTQIKSWGDQLADGTSSGQIDTVIVQERTLNASASEELNLYDGSLSDINGVSAGLQTVKRVIIYQIANPDGSTASSGMTIGNAGTNPNALWFGATGHTAAVNGLAGVPFMQGDDAGKTVSAGAAALKVLNNDGSNKLTYRIVLGGRHV